MKSYDGLMIAGFFLCIFSVSVSRAHDAELFIEDNGDGTVFIQAGVSTGGPAAGASVIIRDKATTQPLQTFIVPDSGKINAPIPKVPYTVTLDMGAGHVLTRTGPLPGGIEKQNPAKKDPAKPLQQKGMTMEDKLVPLSAAVVLLFVPVLVLIISARLRKKTDDFLKRRGRP
jgi:hypothetical protein